MGTPRRALPALGIALALAALLTAASAAEEPLPLGPWQTGGSMLLVATVDPPSGATPSSSARDYQRYEALPEASLSVFETELLGWVRSPGVFRAHAGGASAGGQHALGAACCSQAFGSQHSREPGLRSCCGSPHVAKGALPCLCLVSRT